jgi:hypothetical protein
MDSSQFSVPPLTGDTLNLGILSISALKDNDLRVCGTNGKTKCTKAIVRMYTTGQAGAGLWNTLDGYGAPLKAGLSGNPMQTTGLNAVAAVTLQEYTIPSTKNVLNLSDLSQATSYAIEADFSNAGAGSYQTTIVLEYGLAL